MKDYFCMNKQYGNRCDTDAQLIDVTLGRKFGGVMDRQARFVEENQLFNEEDWMLFVEQFGNSVDDADKGWRGEYFGKMMRGACMTYQYTKNEALYNLLYKVAEYMLTRQEDCGRFSTYSLDCELDGWDMWSRKYVLLGFLHFYEICKDETFKERILQALIKHLDYIVDNIGHGEKREIATTSECWGGINSASILEPVMRMYNLTQKASYLEFAEYLIEFLSESNVNIFTLAAEDKLMPYQYPVTKAYEMMSCFEGLLEYYRVTGEEKYKETVIKFVDRVKESDITIIGCAGCEHELFNHSAATQTDTDYTGIMQETCVTVTWMKLCNQLLLLTGDAKYADYIEHSYYNALCGAINNEKSSENGGFIFDSYSPLTLGKRGRFIGGYKDISDTKHYGCCAAIGAAGTALPLLTAVNESKNGIAVNYYEKGSIEIKGYKLLIETKYPASGKVKVTVTKANANKKEIAFRIPAFSGAKSKIYVNGVSQPIRDCEGAFYAEICREWSDGDVIEIDFDMNPRFERPCGVEGKPETKNYFAVLFGPIVLARESRVSEVGTKVEISEKLHIEPKTSDDFDCIFRADVTVGDTVIDMVDYGSAGKTWNDSSLTEAWIKC